MLKTAPSSSNNAGLNSATSRHWRGNAPVFFYARRNRDDRGADFMRHEHDWHWLTWQCTQFYRKGRSLALTACGIMLLLCAAAALEPMQLRAHQNVAVEPSCELSTDPTDRSVPSTDRENAKSPNLQAISDVDEFDHLALRRHHIASILGLRCESDFADGPDELRSFSAADKE
jgi:hypothetical protein